MSQPRLSFVMPVYEPKLDIFERCLKSLKVQALKDWELIIILDGPNSEAKTIINKIFKDDARAITITIMHSGVQKARNTGATVIHGEFLCFWDADCIIEPGASQMWVEQFDKHPETIFIYSGYKFIGDRYAIESEGWDPYTLRIRNYISTCFPMRKEFYPGWTEGLKSLQDWDMWLSVLEKAEEEGKDISKIGLFVKGYAFSTPMPDENSISGQGCKPENWLDRMDAVKKLHKLPERNICVCSLQYKHEGLALAKLISADYQDHPNDKPNRYKTIIQIGFSLGDNCEKHAAIFQQKDIKRIVFWTGENINEIWNAVSGCQIDAMATTLNQVATQYVEDKEAQRLMQRWGFNVEILSLPLGAAKPLPLPESKRWIVDIAGQYSPLFSVIEKALPDIPIEVIGPNANLSEYTGMIHFFPDRTLSSSVKKALLSGRHVISNIQQPYCGYIDDKWDIEKFIIETVDAIRKTSSLKQDDEAINYYAKSVDKLLEVLA